MKQAKALYITNLGLLDNLARTQVLPYLEGLAKNGVVVKVLSYEKKEKVKNTAALKALREKLNDNGIKWEYLIYHRRWGNIWDVLAGMMRSLRIAGKEKIDILHARASIPILIAWPIAKLLRRKVIYDRRGTMAGDFVDDVNEKNLFSFSVVSGAVNALENFIMRRSDAVIVLSERALGLLKSDARLSKTRSALESIPCCVDLSRFNKDRGANMGGPSFKDKFTVCYLGSLGTCYLLKEMACFYKALKKARGDAFFLIISHTERGHIDEVLAGEGLRPDVDYSIMSLEPDEVGQYLSQTKFGIMFIKPVECKVGSSPTKFAESLAAGIPVIVNKGIGDTEDIIGERKVGVIVEGFDPASFEKAIREISDLLKTEGLKDRCVKTAIERFSLDLGIERYVNVYKKIIR